MGDRALTNSCQSASCLARRSSFSAYNFARPARGVSTEPIARAPPRAVDSLASTNWRRLSYGTGTVPVKKTAGEPGHTRDTVPVGLEGTFEVCAEPREVVLLSCQVAEIRLSP